MLHKIRHFARHSRVLKMNPSLAYKVARGYARALILRRPTLRTVELALLTECNSKCVMCYASKMKREDDAYLTVDEYRRLWAQASKMGAFSVVLSGGEPTLRKDLFDVISVMEPGKTVFALVTNSSRLNPEFLRDLYKAGVATIHMSLDGIDPEANDAVRGLTGHFDMVMRSIDNAKKTGFKVYLSTVIMSGGLTKMRQMVEFAKSKQIGIVFSLACASGNWSDAKDVLLKPEEWQEVQAYMRANPHVRSDWTINYSLKTECPGGREKLSISPYGDVTGCGMNYISFGNIRREPLPVIWRRMGNFPYFKNPSPDCLIGAHPEYIQNYIRPIGDMCVPVPIDRHPLNPISMDKLDQCRR